MEDITYKVPGISSGHCETAITAELRQVQGVMSISVDIERKLVEVRGADLNSEAIVAAIDEAGYEAVIA